MRILQIKTLDGMQKKLQVDDSHTVGQLMVTICTKMGRWRASTLHTNRQYTDRHRQTNRSPSVPKWVGGDNTLHYKYRQIHTEPRQYIDRVSTLHTMTIYRQTDRLPSVPKLVGGESIHYTQYTDRHRRMDTQTDIQKYKNRHLYQNMLVGAKHHTALSDKNTIHHSVLHPYTVLYTHTNLYHIR